MKNYIEKYMGREVCPLTLKTISRNLARDIVKQASENFKACKVRKFTEDDIPQIRKAFERLFDSLSRSKVAEIDGPVKFKLSDYAAYSLGFRDRRYIYDGDTVRIELRRICEYRMSLSGLTVMKKTDTVYIKSVLLSR